MFRGRAFSQNFTVISHYNKLGEGTEITLLKLTVINMASIHLSQRITSLVYALAPYEPFHYNK